MALSMCWLMIGMIDIDSVGGVEAGQKSIGVSANEAGRRNGGVEHEGHR